MSQRKRVLEENARLLLNSRKKTMQSPSQQAEFKTIVLKNLEGNKKSKKEDKQSLDSNLLIEELNKLALGLLEQSPGYPLLKDSLSPAVQEHFLYELLTAPSANLEHRQQANQFLAQLFEKIANKITDLRDQVFNFLNDFKYFLGLMLRCLENLEPTDDSYASFLSMMNAFGRAFTEESASCSVLFLESVGLEYILEYARKYSNKRDALAHVLMSFTPKEFELRYRILEKVAKLLGPDVATLSSLLAHMSTLQGFEGFEQQLFDFYWLKAIQILKYPSPKMRTNGRTPSHRPQDPQRDLQVQHLEDLPVSGDPPTARR